MPVQATIPVENGYGSTGHPGTTTAFFFTEAAQLIRAMSAMNLRTILVNSQS
jgi:hypothetical protein